MAIGAVTVRIEKEPSDVVKGMRQEVAIKGEDNLKLCPRGSLSEHNVLGVYRFASYSDDGPLARLG